MTTPAPQLRAVLSLAAFGLSATIASAVTLNLNSTADTYLRGGSSDQAFGATSSLLVGSHSSVGPFTGLFRFDLSTLPTSGITIDSVTLTLKSSSNGSGTNVTLNVFELSAANADWVEGAENGSNGDGSSTWTKKVRDLIAPVGPEADWAGSPGARTAGTDYINTSLASFTGNASTIGTGNLVFTSTAAFLTSVGASAGGNLTLWTGTPTSTGNNDFFRIESRETAFDPLLTINYSVAPIPEPSAFAVLAGVGVLGLAAVRRRRRI